MVSPSRMNQTGLGWGVPAALTVVSQATVSSFSRRATRAPNSVLVSICMFVFSIPRVGVFGREHERSAGDSGPGALRLPHAARRLDDPEQVVCQLREVGRPD